MFSIIKDLLTSGAAITTIIVAILGLNKWFKELKGRTEFDVARNLLKSTLNLREEIKRFRSPLVGSNEFPEGYQILSNENTSIQKADALAFVFQNRMLPVWNAIKDFDSATIEAEVLWGNKIYEKAMEFRHCVIEINVAIQSVVLNETHEGVDFESNKDFGMETRSKLSSFNDHIDKRFINKIDNSIKAIEDFVKHYLRKN